MKKSVGIIALFLVFISFISINVVSSQETDIGTPQSPLWDEEEHSVWHDAEDIKVALGTGSNALDISLQDWIDTNFKIEWVEEGHSVWHDADEIKVEVSDKFYTLQDWIDAFDTTEPPVETEEFLQSGSIISIKGKSEGNFLSINSPIISMSDGLYANRDEAKLWENFEINLDEGSGDITSGDTIELISQKTEASLQVVNSGSREGRVHARKPRSGDISVGAIKFEPQIMKETGEGKIKCGDEVSFKLGERYLDIESDRLSKITSIGSKTIFKIYGENGECTDGGTSGTGSGGSSTLITNDVDPLTARGEESFILPDGQSGNDADTENYQKFCTSSEISSDPESGTNIYIDGETRRLGKRVGYINSISLRDVSIRENNSYRFICNYGSDTTPQIRSVNLSRNYNLIVVGDEPHYTSTNLFGGSPSADSIDGVDKYGFYVKIVDDGKLMFNLQRIESCREVTIEVPDCTQASGTQCPSVEVVETQCSFNVNVCPAYNLNGFIGSKVWYGWDRIECEIEDVNPPSQ